MQQRKRTQRPDIDAAKERFRRGELALDSYLQSLVDAHRAGLTRDEPEETEDDLDAVLAEAELAALQTAADEEPPDDEPEPYEIGSWEAAASAAVFAGRFELQQRLAAGGMAEIWRARDLLAERFDAQHATVCVAVLDRALDEERLGAALRTAAKIRSLHHPNIAQVLELHVSGDDYAIVSEWLEGEPLAQRLARPGTLAPAELRVILSGMAAALGHAHERGIVHGDIRPENVFVTPDGRIKLLNFGLRVTGAAPQESGPPGGGPGIAVSCASCEVLEGEQPVPADDVYAVACMIYRMVAGGWPHGPRDALGAEFERIQPRRPAGMRRDAWRVLQRGLAYRRGARSESIRELVAPFVDLRPPRAWRRVALLTALVLGIGAAWLTWRGPGEIVPPRADAPGAAVTPQTAPTGTPAPAPPAEPAPAAETAGPPPAAAPGPVPPRAAAEPGVAAPPPSPPAAAGSPRDVMSAAPAPADVVPGAPVRAPPAAGAAVERGGAARRPIVGFRSAAQIVVPESVGYVRIGVAARGSLRGPVRLSVTPAGGAARIHEDFVLPATEITLDPDQPAGDVLVAIVSDGIPENVEDFRLQLRLEAGDADIGTDGIDVVVTDDD